MKKIFFFIIIFVVSAKSSQSQNSDTLSPNIKNDSVLKKIFSLLPEGWKVSDLNNKIIIERIDSVLILNEDRYNDKNKILTKVKQTEKIKTLGVKAGVM